MKWVEKELFLKRSFASLSVIYEQLREVKEIHLKELPVSETAVIIVDMVNGFIKEGKLKSEEIGALIPAMVEFLTEVKKRGIPILAFADCHSENCPEFASYPPHCIKNTSESEIIDEIKELGGYFLIHKNSTNGFLEEKFQEWLLLNEHVKNFVIVGNCTDICVMQLALSLKAYFNKNNEIKEIIVPIQHVETYDWAEHNADLMNIMSLYMMKNNGIKIVSRINF